MIEIRRVQDGEEWDGALLGLPNPHALQSHLWGDFKGRWGWKPHRLLFEERGRAVAAAQVLERHVSFLPMPVMYVSKGPALDYDDPLLAERVLHYLEEFAREQKGIFVKIDPDLPRGTGERGGDIPPATKNFLSLLSQRGWRFSSEQIQFKNTVRLDLIPPEDALMAAMKQKTRYNVRLSSRRGVGVREGGAEDLEAFYSLYLHTSRRDGFLIRPFEYYRDVWGSFIEGRMAHLLLAEMDGAPIAGLVLFRFGETAWYMYGASGPDERSLMPNYLLQWEAMLLAKRLGCTGYDMWGAPDTFNESDPMWGVYRFKQGFGGVTVRGLGAHDFPPSPPAYALYRFAMPLALRVMRGRAA